MKKLLIFIICFSIFAGVPQKSFAQDGNDIFAADDDDLNIGGDIFSDFNEELESAKVAEDERFYRFGRFFSFNVGLVSNLALSAIERRALFKNRSVPSRRASLALGPR
jgi:hypothetical protein